MGSVSVAALALTSALGALVGAIVGALATTIFGVRTLRHEEHRTQAAVAKLTETIEASSQAWFWTPEWQAGEAEADADIAAGRVTVVDSVEAMDTALDDAVRQYTPASGSKV